MSLAFGVSAETEAAVVCALVIDVVVDRTVGVWTLYKCLSLGVLAL